MKTAQITIMMCSTLIRGGVSKKIPGNIALPASPKCKTYSKQTDWKSHTWIPIFFRERVCSRNPGCLFREKPLSWNSRNPLSLPLRVDLFEQVSQQLHSVSKQVVSRRRHCPNKLAPSFNPPMLTFSRVRPSRSLNTSTPQHLNICLKTAVEVAVVIFVPPSLPTWQSNNCVITVTNVTVIFGCTLGVRWFGGVADSSLPTDCDHPFVLFLAQDLANSFLEADCNRPNIYFKIYLACENPPPKTCSLKAKYMLKPNIS